MNNVLIADDDPISRRLLEVSLIRAGYPVSVATNGADALRLLEQPDGPRLAILDWMMPGMDGVDICRIIRKSSREAYVYVILLSARVHQTEIIQGLEAGADDYVIKPFDLPELKARLRTGIRILELQEQLVSAREQLRVEATHDPLTGMWNHKSILDIVQKEFVRSKREGSPVAVIMADIDHFKHVNDTYGHAVGDAVLRETTRRMSGSIRPYDSIGRYGGDEFLIVIPGCGIDETTDLADRIRQSVCGQGIDTSGAGVTLTLSLGVADAADFPQADQLLLAADNALYCAKDAGRNRVEVTLVAKNT